MNHPSPTDIAAAEAPDAVAPPAAEGLRALDEPLHPVRGLIPLHNERGQFFDELDIRRWINLSVASFKAEKLDLHVEGSLPESLEKLVLYAHDPNLGFGLQASLRTDCSAPPDGLEPLVARDLFDVLLCPANLDSPHLDEWLDACGRHELPVRVEIAAPLPADVDGLAERLARPPVKVVDVMVAPVFGRPGAACGASETPEQAARMNALARNLAARGIESNLIGLPLCHVDEDNLVRGYNRQQYFLDHQHYGKRAFEFAQVASRRRPWAVSKLVQISLGRETSRRTIIDSYLLSWLMLEHPALHSVLAMLRRMTRHIRIFAHTPKPLAPTKEAYETALAKQAAQEAKRLGAECSACAYRRICDHCPPEVRKRLPGLAPKRVEGELVVGARHFTKRQPKYLDGLEQMRLSLVDHQLEMAAEANDVVMNTKPTKEYGFTEWSLENSFCIQMPGALQWFSMSNKEVISGSIGWFDTPYTVAVTFGEGIADQIGFGIGDYTRILCPMEAFMHQLVLHVDTEGRYVLLRDGVRVEPTRFEDKAALPVKAPTTAPVRLIAHNIDRYLFTQNLLVWEGNRKATEQRTGVKYSVVIVSTRFARRLQAVLRSIAHQRDFDMSQLEVIVAYVPGLDPTDDLLTSVQLAYPDMRIVRAPFHEKNAKAKGHLINESSKLAAGEWILLLDSDILIPPNMFAYLDENTNGAPFIAPDSRKMLSPETTAKVVLGEIEPWNEWDALMESPGRIRKKEGGHLPVGFFQCVRADLFRKIGYQEFDHFQGADWDFIVGMYQEFGPGRWLSEVSVCHLDHGGSQWFGAKKQM